MILLVDGRSGSGKTTFSHRLHSLLGWPVVHVEDFYPGWNGLAEASAQIAQSVLNPTRKPSQRGYLRWNWHLYDFEDWVATPGGGEDTSLIIEGCGALTQENLAAARLLGDGQAWGIWLELPAAERYRRAMARDELFADYWHMWAEQEKEHYRRHRPWLLADWIVNRSLYS